jgi:hypothetical protein
MREGEFFWKKLVGLGDYMVVMVSRTAVLKVKPTEPSPPHPQNLPEYLLNMHAGALLSSEAKPLEGAGKLLCPFVFILQTTLMGNNI